MTDQKNFGFTNIATTHNSHPETSHAAAQRINDIGSMQDRCLFSLKRVIRHNGMKRKDIGILTAMELTGLTEQQVRDVLMYSGMATKRIKDIERKKWIEVDGDGRCSVIDLGLRQL